MEKKLWLYRFLIIIAILIGSQLFNENDIYAEDNSFCNMGNYVAASITTVGDKATAVGSCVSVGDKPDWALLYQEYLIKISKVIALMVKSLALLYIIYSGFMYMRIENDVKQVMQIKGNLVSAFMAIFIAASAQMIIEMLWGVLS